MSLTYTGDAGIFTHIGILIKCVNEIPDDLSTWDDRETEIQSIFDTGLQHAAEAPLIGIVNQIQSSLASTRESLSGIADLRLQDYATVISILDVPNNSIPTILTAMIIAMRIDVASVNANVVTLGTVTAAAANVGNGTVLVSKILDGFTSPIFGAQARPAYLGLDSEFSVSDTMTFDCSSDSFTDRLTAGFESFTWYGTKGLDSKWSEGTPGAGQGPAIRTTQSGRLLSNMDFETFTTTNTPDNWTIAAGVVTTNVLQATGAGNFYTGASSVKLLGDGVAAAITITQAISNADPLRGYFVSFRYKASATDAGKTFTVILTGTGYTAASTEKVEIAGASLATSWTLANFFVVMPANLPTDLAMSISFSGTPTATRYILIDSFGMIEATYHNGIAAAAVAGSTSFVKGDRFTVSVDNTNEGVIQSWFVRNYLVQLPSVTTGLETISDGLAI